MDNLPLALIVILVLFIIYNIWFRPEYLTDDEIAQSIIANAMLRDPQDSTAIIRAMSPAQQKQYEHLVPGDSLPFNPNYYKEKMSGLPYNPNYYKEQMTGNQSRYTERMSELPYNPNYYSEKMTDPFVMALYA
jgi:hypothetical protein